MEKSPIAVFFTHGVSLKLWEQRGMFSREVRFYQALANQTGEVWFFTYGRTDHLFEHRVGKNIHIFQKNIPVPNIIYSFLLPFIYWKQLSKARVIRIHQMAGAIPALMTHWILRKPLLVRCGYQWSRFLDKAGAKQLKQFIIFLIEYITYKTASKIILSTDADAEYVSKKYSVKSQKISVISNYIDIDLFKQIQKTKERNSVCFVGRLSSEKNLLNLIKAVSGTKVNLIFYGDGVLKERLEQEAKNLKVHLDMRGTIQNELLPEALNTCELFILPSLHEGNPKALLEAMACGLPVIGTRVEGIDSIIEHGVNGILCETDPQAIRKAILDLLENPEKQKSLGKEAREKIIETASLSNAIDHELKILNLF